MKCSAFSLFLSHLHDGERQKVGKVKEIIFLSHLHDGEPAVTRSTLIVKFLSHLHDGELLLLPLVKRL